MLGLFLQWFMVVLITLKTLKAVLVKAFFIETFLVKGKSEILNFFFFIYIYDVILLKWNTCVISSDPPFMEWHVRCTFETFISPSFLKQEMRESLL